MSEGSGDNYIPFLFGKGAAGTKGSIKKILLNRLDLKLSMVFVCRNRLFFWQVKVLQGELSVRLLSTGKQRPGDRGL